ncbi:hypothetical protein [Nocardia sp. NPDC048505]|uniref:hypothetical protein n=1 Tax=unclassified Nocardia TaxID=2637762 RepID=UPI0034023504
MDREAAMARPVSNSRIPPIEQRPPDKARLRSWLRILLDTNETRQRRVPFIGHVPQAPRGRDN